jgi:hypothetical protein
MVSSCVLAFAGREYLRYTRVSSLAAVADDAVACPYSRSVCVSSYDAIPISPVADDIFAPPCYCSECVFPFRASLIRCYIANGAFAHICCCRKCVSPSHASLIPPLLTVPLLLCVFVVRAYLRLAPVPFLSDIADVLA